MSDKEEIERLTSLLQDISDSEGITPGIIQMQDEICRLKKELSEAVDLLELLIGQNGISDGHSHLECAVNEFLSGRKELEK